MLDDPRARALWRRYQLRARYALAATAPSVRRELLEDLSAHVGEALRAGELSIPEFDRLSAILIQLGEPEEFLAPLISDAILSRTGPSNAVVASIDAISAAWRLGVRVSAAAFAYPLVGLTAFAMAVLATMRIAAPDTAGVFMLARDEYQVRLIGGAASGVQIMPLWFAILLLPLCVIAIFWAARRVQALALALALGKSRA